MCILHTCKFVGFLHVFILHTCKFMGNDRVCKMHICKFMGNDRVCKMHICKFMGKLHVCILHTRNPYMCAACCFFIQYRAVAMCQHQRRVRSCTCGRPRLVTMHVQPRNNDYNHVISLLLLHVILCINYYMCMYICTGRASITA